jgi:serine/threonine-protein kinase
MPDLTGQSFGRYHLLEKLGEGGMATVYKAYDTRLEREVAVKIIRKEAFPSEVIERMLKRFEREAKAMAKLSHANIVKVYDYGEHEGSPYIVMELLSGGTLKQRLGYAMPWQEAVSLVEPIARALAYAHNEGILHRDVKPANILITKSGEPMLTDFGIAKLLEREEGHTLTGTGVGVGTPEYIAPEQGLGQEVDGRADVYSLGIVLYELITGRKPYIADTPLAVLLKQVNDPLPRPSTIISGLPEQVEHVLIKALSKKPEDRYNSMGEFAAALSGLERQSPHPQPRTQIASVTPPLRVEKPDRQGPDPHATVDELETGAAIVQQIPSKVLESSPIQISQGSEQISQGKPGTRVVGFLLGGLALLIILIVGGVNGWFGPKPTPAPTAAPVVQPTNTIIPIVQPTITSIPPTSTQSFGIVTTLESEKDGMVMVYVPAGEFSMGSNEGDSDEKPVHTVYLDAYWIDQTEVTNGMYAKCVAEGDCIKPAESSSYTRDTYYGNFAFANYPVIYINWNQAETYCQWAGRNLPTEAQWEYAARGTDGRTYPWGNTNPTWSVANSSAFTGDTTAAGIYPDGVSPYGALDMAGNLWEWVADWYGSYPSGAVANPRGATSGDNRVLRGGSWDVNPLLIRTTNRLWCVPNRTDDNIGFRCAVDAD